MKKEETAEAAALKIAAEIMVAAGMCQHESTTMCKRLYVDEDVCEKCIRMWLIRKGRERLKASG